ncbi:MAG: acetyl-CoA carboxylase carboxyltransferase subunit beta [Candidatus Saccharibacteria bacterium]
MIKDHQEQAEKKSRKVVYPSDFVGEKKSLQGARQYGMDKPTDERIYLETQDKSQSTARARLRMLVDEDSFVEISPHLASCDPLGFPGYKEKICKSQEKTGSEEAIIIGIAYIGGFRVVIGVMEPDFMMASMGSVVGEKVCRAVEKAIELKYPFIISACSGGARMQEGIISLMQMAKTSAAVARLHEAGILYISIINHPTTGGVLASFISLADIIIAEPGALVGFAGPRVIKQTIGEQLPVNFQRSESLLQHGMIDLVVEYSQQRQTVERILRMHFGGNYGNQTI